MSIPDNAIAVVGMAGKFPGANDLSAFWSNLRRGKESIVTLSEQELRDEGVSEQALSNSSYVRRAPLLDGIDEFDAGFFGFPPQAAQVLDPQHRLFLQCAWHALEDAGCDPARFDGSIGVYGTSSPSGYLLHNLMSHRDPNAVMAEGLNFDQFSLFLQNDKDFLATRISHQFDLRGPSLAVQTACSSSLVAVHLACLSLLSGECDMALAGGVSLCVPNRVGYWHSPGQMLSAVGRCRPFDVRADGTVFGSGVGLVVLKPLQAALDNGDRIHAVIRGSAINNDGSAKMGFAAPSASAQADCIAEAHAVSDVDASTISYVETHGTGTPLGDPIEIQGLRTAFDVSEEPRSGPCVIGSVKSNIGHLEVAAGIAALIKTILCLKNKAIPATLHYTSANPELRLDETPFTVQSRYGAWESDGTRRAGVSSFGIGGTNAHVVVEEAPQAPVRTEPPGPQVLLLSAHTAAALGEARTALAAALERPNAPEVSDVAYTLAGRRRHNVTMAAVVADRAGAVSLLRAAEHDDVFVGESVADSEAANDRVVFMFPGQGAQHIGMAKGLYETEPVFAEHFDACATAFQAESGLNLRAAIFGAPDAATDLDRIDRSQPALFTVEYALAKLVDSYGVQAGAYIGYSTGEYVAATLAGVFDLATAVKTVSLRSRLMHESPPGAMVAVAAGPTHVAQHLVPGTELSSVNDPGNCVVAGPKDAIRTFVQRLSEHDIPVRRVRATHAFHTSAMDVMLPEFQDFLSRQQLNAPGTRLLSNLTGTWLSNEQATDPVFWTRQISSTIRFADELDAVLTDPKRVLVEVGPGGSLTGSAIRHPKWPAGHRSVRLMRHPIQQADDRNTFLRGLGELWSAGVDIDWSPLHSAQPTPPGIVSLPGYPFERQRHWIEPKAAVWKQGGTNSNGSSAGAFPVMEGATRPAAESTGTSQTATTLQSIWEQCLGVPSIDPNTNFFDLGGDSLTAISVAMSGANEGLSITPQDLYEHPTLASLTAAVDAAFAASGLAKPPEPEADPAMLPNTTYFLERGLRDGGRWRIPLILRLDSTVTQEDIRAVLTAVANHHDALRLQLIESDGVWEQHIAPPLPSPTGFADLSIRSLPGDLPGGLGSESAEERAATSKILTEVIAEQSDSTAPLIGVHITGGSGGPNYLGIGVHAMVADPASLQILGSDIITAFGQHLAGQAIALEPEATGWREWSQRSAALSTHPAALDTRAFWTENAAKVTRWLTGDENAANVTASPTADDLATRSCTLNAEQTFELDDARRKFRRSIQEILLAALGRTIAQTVSEGVVAVELEGEGRSVLRPHVDLRRTVGWCTTYYPVALTCATGEGAAVIDQLAAVHDTLKSVPHYGIGYGLLRYVYAPTGRSFGAQRTPDIHFRYLGAIPELPPMAAAVQFESDVTAPVRETIPGLGHAIEVRVYRFAGATQIDWWYDTRRVPTATIESLTEAFPRALSELIQEGLDALAAEQIESEVIGVPEAGALVDLSSLD